jgi:hypothetical protein
MRHGVYSFLSFIEPISCPTLGARMTSIRQRASPPASSCLRMSIMPCGRVRHGRQRC